MCVLAGCDFLPSIHGIGVRRAYSLVSKHRNLDRVRPFLSPFDMNFKWVDLFALQFRKWPDDERLNIPSNVL